MCQHNHKVQNRKFKSPQLDASTSNSSQISAFPNFAPKPVQTILCGLSLGPTKVGWWCTLRRQRKRTQIVSPALTGARVRCVPLAGATEVTSQNETSPFTIVKGTRRHQDWSFRPGLEQSDSHYCVPTATVSHVSADSRTNQLQAFCYVLQHHEISDGRTAGTVSRSAKSLKSWQTTNRVTVTQASEFSYEGDRAKVTAGGNWVLANGSGSQNQTDSHQTKNRFQ